jgi:uncharacterized SAM-binding protein YcdF (DUF218 family)
MFINLKQKRKHLVIVIILLLLGVFLFNAGSLLVESVEPKASDLIVVLMGSGPDRVLFGVDLYKQGFAEQIVMAENKQTGYEHLESLGVSIPRDPELAALVGIQLGMPAEAFVILPGDAGSTQDEALIVTDYLESHPEYEQLILVTSRYHSARSACIFRWAVGHLDREVDVLSCPTPYDDFKPDRWWASREDMKRVVLEYAKWANFYLLDRWR